MPESYRKFMLIAGEASGDTLGAELVKALRAEPGGEKFQFFGAGGPKLAAAGAKLSFDLTAHAVVGIVEVIGEYRPDPTDETGVFGLVIVKAVKDMSKPVTLADCKANPKLKDMSLVHWPRLSVQPVTPAEWKEVCRMGGLK